MKRIKKLLAVLLAVVMVASMGSMSVMAADYSIKITGVATGSHTFSAWQIFDGDVSNETLSNVSWGSGVDTSRVNAIYTELADVSITVNTGTVYPFTDSEQSGGNALSSAEAVAKALAKYYSNAGSEIADAFATVMNSYLTSAATKTVSAGTEASGSYTYTIEIDDPGYYLVKDTTTSLDKNDAYTDFIVRVLGTQEVAVKSSVPSVTKTVTSAVSGNETNATSASAGDEVSFTLTATMPSTYADYSTYALTFHDALSNNLTYDRDSVVVTVNNYAAQSHSEGDSLSGTLYVLDNDGAYVVTKDTTAQSGTTYYTRTTTVAFSGYTVTTPSDEDYNLEIAISDTNELKDENNGNIAVDSTTTIVVTYTASVNSGISSANHETNSVVLEYSNNPNGSGTGKTTEEKVYVYTYDLDVYKTDEESNGLSGASFTLYKKVSIDEFATETTYYTLSSSTATAMTQVGESESYKAETTYYVKVGNETIASQSGTDYIAKFNDLGEGDYVLAETKTPAGYNTAAVVQFTISAAYADNGASVTALSGGSNTEVAAETGSTSTLKTTVVNNSGSTIPSTGGIGTTIFYVVGAVLVVSAVVILVTRRRMENKA